MSGRRKPFSLNLMKGSIQLGPFLLASSLWPAGEKPSHKEAEPKDRFTMGAGVHDLFLHDPLHVLVNFLSMIDRISYGLLQGQ